MERHIKHTPTSQIPEWWLLKTFCISDCPGNLGTIFPSGLVGIQGSSLLPWRSRNKEMQMSALHVGVICSWRLQIIIKRANLVMYVMEGLCFWWNSSCSSWHSSFSLLYFILFLLNPSRFPLRNISLRSVSSRSLCLRTITSPTPPWCTGSRPPAGPGTSDSTRKARSWRGTTWRKTRPPHTSYPNPSKVMQV